MSLHPTPVSIPLGITASAILSTGDYRSADYRVRTESKSLDLCALNVYSKTERWGDEAEGLNIKIN